MHEWSRYYYSGTLTSLDISLLASNSDSPSPEQDSVLSPVIMHETEGHQPTTPEVSVNQHSKPGYKIVLDIIDKDVKLCDMHYGFPDTIPALCPDLQRKGSY